MLARHGRPSPSGLLSRSSLNFGQALNCAGKAHQRGSVKYEVDADHYADEIGASNWPRGQKVDTESEGHESRENRPSPPRKLNDASSDPAEQPSNHEERREDHGHSLGARIRMANQEVSSYPANDCVQQEQKESMPTEGIKRVDEPHHSADHEHPT